MCRLLFFIIFFLNMTVENCHSSTYCDDSTINSKVQSSVTAFCATEVPSQEDTDKSMDHGCSLCHCHMVILKLKTNSLPTVAIAKNFAAKFFYQDLYSFLSVSSFFRPPIA